MNNINECLKYLFQYPQVHLQKSYKASSRKDVIYHKNLENALKESLKQASLEFFPKDKLNLFLDVGNEKEYLDLTPEDINKYIEENYVTYIPYKNREFLPDSFNKISTLTHFEHTILSSIFPLDIDECEITFLENGLKIVAPGLRAFFTLEDNVLISCKEEVARAKL